MTEGLDAASIVLRWLLYIATVSAAGGVLFKLSFPSAATQIRRPLARQICFGSLAIPIIETLRYAVFQLEAGGGDWVQAFAPDLRFMAFSTAFGTAALLRAASAFLVLIGGRLDHRIPNLGAALMIGSYALEGHTVGDDGPNLILALVLLVHVTAVHGWIGALPPLLHLSRHAEASQFRETVESFGRRAQWIVAFLAAAGVTLFIVLSGGTIDPANPYQQRFGLKLLLVCAILGLAAINKFSLTPQLQSKDSDQARAALSKSIVLESCLAAAILLATAVMLAHAPAVD